MIRVGPKLYIFPQHVVGLSLSTVEGTGEPCIDVHSPDGTAWPVTESMCNQPINEQTLLELANEIARQLGQAPLAPLPYRAPVVPITSPGIFANPNKPKQTDTGRLLDDEIPF